MNNCTRQVRWIKVENLCSGRGDGPRRSHWRYLRLGGYPLRPAGRTGVQTRITHSSARRPVVFDQHLLSRFHQRHSLGDIGLVMSDRGLEHALSSKSELCHYVPFVLGQLTWPLSAFVSSSVPKGRWWPCLSLGVIRGIKWCHTRDSLRKGA